MLRELFFYCNIFVEVVKIGKKNITFEYVIIIYQYAQNFEFK